jgi:ketosteroid isomerase-like protein
MSRLYRQSARCNRDFCAPFAYLPLITAGKTSRRADEKEKIMSNIDLAKAYIKSVQTGDMATFGSLFAEDFTWHQPGNNRFSGAKRGMGELGPMLGGMMAASGGTFAISKANRFLENGDMVAVESELLSQPGIDLIRFKDGKIVEVWLLSSDPAQEDLFWGK